MKCSYSISPPCSPLATAATVFFWLGVGQLDTIGNERNVVILFLLKGQLGDVLEGLFDVNGFFGTSLEVRNVTLLLAPSHSSLLADNTLVVQIDFVAYNHEGEVVRIAGSSLDQKFVSPRFQIFEGLGNIDVVNQNAAIGTSVESDAQRLEAFLTSSIPNLHGNEAIIDHNILRQKVGTNGGLVLVAEFFVDICIVVLRNNTIASKLIRKYVS
jgi:hypothetical protein